MSHKPASEFSNAQCADAPRSDQPALLKALAEDLAAINFSAEAVAALLGAEAYAALDGDQLIPAAMVLEAIAERGADATGAALAAVVRLWILAQDVERDSINVALPQTRAEGLIALGLAEAQGSSLRAIADLRPYAFDAASRPDEEPSVREVALWVASDLGAHQRPGVLRRDHVLGIGQASTTLAQITVRQPVKRALDLGTGCGIQTFHLLTHAEEVVATDISPRALAFTRFNLLLNAAALRIDPQNLAGRVSLRLGSLLEPVAGERFEQIVSNPPFVITPRRQGESASEQFTYRDGGLPGDAIVSSLIQQLPGALNPGGVAQMLGNWEVVRDSAWDERPRQWLPEYAQAWFIQRELLTPAQYAQTWLQDASESRDAELYERSFRDYLSDFASRQVSGIGFGMVLLRRPPTIDGGVAAAPWQRFEEITYPIEQPLGPRLSEALLRFDALDALAASHQSAGDSHAVAALQLTVAEDVTEERHQRPGAEHPGVILLRQGAGLRRTELLSSALAGFVSACDGELPAGVLAAAVVSLIPETEGASEQARTLALLDEAQNLIDAGFLIIEPGK